MDVRDFLKKVDRICDTAECKNCPLNDYCDGGGGVILWELVGVIDEISEKIENFEI
jgi:hypothetical protein